MHLSSTHSTIKCYELFILPSNNIALLYVYELFVQEIIQESYWWHKPKVSASNEMSAAFLYQITRKQ